MEHELNFVQQIQGVHVKDVITKFFYKENQLCFQLLLHVEGGDTLLFQEFSDYSAYKQTLEVLHKAKANDAVVKIPGKKRLNNPLAAKVA